MTADLSAKPPALPADRPPDGTSTDLLLRARGGDSQARNRLFTRLLPALRYWAHGRLPRWARGAIDTADLVQDAVLNTIHHLSRFEPRHRGALRAYLRRAVENRIRDELRRVGRRPGHDPLDSDHVDAGPSPLDAVAEEETRRRYLAALERLRPDERTMIVARLELQLSLEQVALLVGKTTEAVRKAVRRGVERLVEDMARV